MKPGLLYLAIPWAIALTDTTAIAATPGLTVDTTQREAVRNFYNALFPASENVPMGWTGAISGCVAGATSAAYKEAGVLRINVLRALAGVPAAVTLNDSFNTKAQQAALMMSAAGRLEHFPPTHFACYTADGAEAAGKSNLSLGYAGADAITFGQMQDEGSNNAAVGHRRWLLYPQTQAMGLGDVAGVGDLNGDGRNDKQPADAVWVQDSHFFDARPATRDDFVAWPPPGYLPYKLAFPRWSLSYPKADFSGAVVNIQRNGANVPVTVESNATTNIGENTLVWRPSDALLSDPTPLANSDATFSVSVQGAKVGGQARNFNYHVTLFDPARTDTDTVLPQVVGATNPAVGRGNVYSIQGAVPAADGFDWLHSPASALTAKQGAENGLGLMLPDTSSGYSVVTSEFAASGVNAYHLMDAKSKRQLLAVDRWLVPGGKAKLTFQSRLGLATASEAAAVQVSLDNGNTWRDIYTQVGNASGIPVEKAFIFRTLPLDGYAGRVVRVRFAFDIPNRSSFRFFSPGNETGWYLDDVAFEDVQSLTAPAVAAADAGGGFIFTPAATGDEILAARGALRGHPLEWGPTRLVRAVAAGANQAPVANAGPDRTVVAGTAVGLDGSGSNDPDNSPGALTFAWTQVSGPTSVTLSNTAQPSFTPTVAGTYVFSLKVSDTALISAADTVSVVVSATPGSTNQPPVADAGSDRTTTVGTSVALDGSASRDPENGPLTFTWTQLSGPAGVALTGSARPGFVPQAAGVYVFSLTVSDGALSSAPDRVSITAKPQTPLTLTAPNGGETFKLGKNVPVRWQSVGIKAQANLQLQFSKNGVKWTLLKTVKNTGQTAWKPTKTQVGAAVRLRLCGPASLPKASRCDETDGTLQVKR